MTGIEKESKLIRTLLVLGGNKISQICDSQDENSRCKGIRRFYKSTFIQNKYYYICDQHREVISTDPITLKDL